MTIGEFVENMKQKASKGLLDVSGAGKLSKRTWTFPKGQAEIMVIRGGAIEKAAIQHMTLKGITMPGVTGEHDAVVYQMEVFPGNPYCPMGHFNTEWMTTEPRRYTINLDLFPAVRVEEDILAMRSAMDVVADRFGKDREKMREMLDTQYTMEHFATPLATRVGCKFRGLKKKSSTYSSPPMRHSLACTLISSIRERGLPVLKVMYSSSGKETVNGFNT